MASPIPPQSGTRRGSRNITHHIPRQSVKDPLDLAEDPLSEAHDESQTSEQSQPTQFESARTTLSVSDTLPEQTSGSSMSSQTARVDLRFLQDHRIYHQELLQDDVAPAFLQSRHQPSPDTPLPELLQHGHFRLAADRAVHDIIGLSGQPEHLLKLFYCRLACMILVGRPEIAADEAVVLLDFISSNSSNARAAQTLVPWELRVLIVRLQSIAAQDGGRRAIMAIYALASESRTYFEEARKANDADNITLWTCRLNDLGLRVADTLVEIGELETADRHLDSLATANGDEVSFRKAILYLRSGNVRRAQDVSKHIENTRHRDLIKALVDHFVDRDQDAWQTSPLETQAAELAANNHAVYLLYSGQIIEARKVLEDVLSTHAIFSTLLLNLSTIHELCGEKALSKKQALVDQVASRLPDAACGGWERSVLDFKL